MFEHRLREFFASTQPAVAVMPTATVPAFVPCPAPVFTSFAPAQASFVAEVYRLAREMTEAQFREQARVRPWPPAFSAN